MDIVARAVATHVKSHRAPDVGPRLQTMAERLHNGRVTRLGGSGTTSVASIKSASQTVLGSALGKVERSMKYPLARPIRVESMSHEDADAEQDTCCRDELGHSSPPSQGPIEQWFVSG
jgi:hypothetical protein